MYTGKLVFSQLMEHLPQDTFLLKGDSDSERKGMPVAFQTVRISRGKSQKNVLTATRFYGY